MTQVQLQFKTRRGFLAATPAALIAFSACSREGSETDAKIKRASKTFKMGERASIGLLTYNILESTYFTQLGNSGKSRLPEKRYLVIRMSITNGGAKEAEIPLFRLIDDNNAEFSEIQEAEFLPGWFGLIRKVGPTLTEEGRILFDVSPKTYKLEVTDGGETGKEQLAFIEIPIEFDTAEPIPAGAQTVPKK
jgi:hypothetical protein